MVTLVGNAQTNAPRASVGKNPGQMKTPDQPKETNQMCFPRVDDAGHSAEACRQKSLVKLPASDGAQGTLQGLRTVCKGPPVIARDSPYEQIFQPSKTQVCNLGGFREGHAKQRTPTAPHKIIGIT
jgi:hypothetical protein